MDIQTVVTGITVGTTSNGRQKFTVMCADGVERSVWEASIANALQPLIGQPVSLAIRQSPKRDGMGFWETITGFGQGGGQPQQFQPTPQFPGQGMAPSFQPQAAGPTIPSQPVPNFPPTPQREGMPEEAVVRITKLACLNSASILVGHLFAGSGPEQAEAATALVLGIAGQYYKAARSHQQNVNQADEDGRIVPPADATPQSIAAAVPGVTVGAPVAPEPEPDDDVWR